MNPIERFIYIICKTIKFLIRRDVAGPIFFAIFAVFIIFSALMLSFGYPMKTDMDDYIIMHTQNETGTNSGVTTVVFDYRGFDTLGEATILFSAVSGVLMIFRKVIN
jgi:multisubunit Na+/H+ antiporter MnhB subunit